MFGSYHDLTPIPGFIQQIKAGTDDSLKDSLEAEIGLAFIQFCVSAVSLCEIMEHKEDFGKVARGARGLSAGSVRTMGLDAFRPVALLAVLFELMHHWLMLTSESRRRLNPEEQLDVAL